MSGIICEICSEYNAVETCYKCMKVCCKECIVQWSHMGFKPCYFCFEKALDEGIRIKKARIDDMCKDCKVIKHFHRVFVKDVTYQFCKECYEKRITS